ncbi:hypothetical protein O181_086866 [Austropuccinia psidii MF-1]|uniref:Uncharacterized protein n=1 Tax=Austropuccinia psidii MF-1 TaxID=1389203 RepID=A0A9Q3INL7_9BASI|nr:hypothetical protein [Austropuccinia psidii MF-1]
MRHDLIDVLYTYKNAFAPDNEPLGAIKGLEVDITFNIDRQYLQVLKRTSYPASLTVREALEKHIQELIVTGSVEQKNKSGLALSNQETHLEDSKE